METAWRNVQAQEDVQAADAPGEGKRRRPSASEHAEFGGKVRHLNHKSDGTPLSNRVRIRSRRA